MSDKSQIKGLKSKLVKGSKKVKEIILSNKN